MTRSLAHCIGRTGRRIGAVALLAGAVTTGAAAQTTVELPLGVGLRWPTYDRINGVTLPVGPIVSLGGGRAIVDPTLAYRSNLGKIDPALTLTLRTADSTVSLVASGERGTFTNDRWIRSDLLNSLASFGLGRDARNYYRGDRAEGTVRLGTTAPDSIAGYVYAGGRFENDWSTGWRPGELRGPYSVFGRSDATDGIQRPNPEIDRGHIASVIAGVHGTRELEYEGRWRAEAELQGEVGALNGGPTFSQITLGANTSIATFAGQQIILAGHWLTTLNGPAPRQRWSYVGGSGTLATVPLLVRGGDHLFLVDGAYRIPIPAIELPIVGAPWLAPHAAIGAAGVGGYGPTIPNVGLRVGVWYFYADAVLNPVSHQHDAGVGVSFGI